ncbi:MAG: polyhydroxyalkanoic acid system family protein [Beijerinckiaceae bacterium]
MAVLGHAGKAPPDDRPEAASLDFRTAVPHVGRMAEPIVVTVSHNLGAEEAQRRIARGLERGKSEFGAIFSAFDVTWRANHADVVVVALKQRIVAGLDVFADMVRVEVSLPWYFAPLQKKIVEILQDRGRKTLQIGQSGRGAA